jgi:uncharacterized membrane protein YfhO
MDTPSNFKDNHSAPKYPLFILLILVAVFFGRDAIPSKGLFIGGSDFMHMVYNRMLYLKIQLSSGSIPLWNPYICGGIPMTPNGMFYPTFLLFLALPLSWAFNIDTMLHIFLATAGMYSFIFLITRSKTVGIAAGIVYGLGGYPMARIMGGHWAYLYSMACLPWIFFFLESALVQKKTAFFLLSGLILGILLLGNVDQNAFYIFYFLTIYFVIRCLVSKITSLRIWCCYLIVPLISFGISAIQLFPFLEFLAQSDRAAKSYDFATYMSFPPEYFYTFLIPLKQGEFEFGGYMGVLTIVLCINGIIFSSLRMYKFIFIIIGFLSITFMLGSYTPVYQLYYKFFPFIGGVRIPARCMIVLIFSISTLAGLGVQQLLQYRQSLKQYTIISIIIPIILAITIVIGPQTFDIPLKPGELRIALCLVIGVAALLTSHRFLATTRITSALVIAFLFLNLFFIYKPLLPKLDENEILEQRSYEKKFVKDSDYYRVILPMQFGDSRAMHHHYFDANGYTFVFLKDYFHFVHDMAGITENPYNRHTVNRELFSKERVFSSKILGIKYAGIFNSYGFNLIESEQYFPRALIIHDVLFLSDKNEHLKYLKDDKFNPKESVLLLSSDKEEIESYITLSPMGTDDESSVQIDNYFPNRIELSSVSYQDGFLLLSEIFYPGWQAYVDGEKTPIFRADYLLRAIPLKAGDHHIVFVYRPMSFILGAAISAATLLLIFMSVIISKSRRSIGLSEVSQG